MKAFTNRASLFALILCTLAPLAVAQDADRGVLRIGNELIEYTHQVATKPEAKQQATPASLMEQGKYAEEQERDFRRAEALYLQAAKAAADAKAVDVQSAANEALERVRRRAAGIATGTAEGENDPLTCRMAERLYDIAHRVGNQEDALRDLALMGALAVPWLEKAIQGPYKLCNYEIISDPPAYIRALAEMSAPEGAAMLEKLLSSPDPIARRSVAQFADPDQHRAILQRALKDPAKAVRDQAVERLAQRSDPTLFDTMAAFAREGNSSALIWLRAKPIELLRIASSENLSIGIRCAALGEIQQAAPFRPDAALIDGLLALARTPAENSLRTTAMEVLIYAVAETWKPVAPEMLRRIEAAILAAPDSYPQQHLVQALTQVGSSASLALIVERTPADELNNVANPVMRIISACGPTDFPAVVAALASAPAQAGGNPFSDAVGSSMFSWLDRTAPMVTSTVLANGANALPAVHRRAYLDRVVGSWLQSNTTTDSAIAKLPKFDAAFLDLLREMTASSNGNQANMAIRGLGASGDPKVLVDLMALMRSEEVNNEITYAIRRLTRSNPQQVRSVLPLLLANKSMNAQNFGNAFRAIIDRPQPKETLAAVNASWSPANADRLLALVTTAVPGPDGSQFLLAHYGELEVSAADTRTRVMQRLGDELYEPALSLIGEALRDPNNQVRNTASATFDRFKAARQKISDFEAWLHSDEQAEKTVGELTALLDSPNPEVVIGAVKALAALKARSIYPKLVGLLDKHKGDEAVKAAIKQAIDDLAK